MKDPNELKMFSGFLIGGFLKVFMAQLHKKQQGSYTHEDILDVLAETHQIITRAASGTIAPHSLGVSFKDSIPPMVNLMEEMDYTPVEGQAGYVDLDTVIERFPKYHEFMADMNIFQLRVIAASQPKDMKSVLDALLGGLKDILPQEMHSESVLDEEHNCDECEGQGTCPIEDKMREERKKQSATGSVEVTIPLFVDKDKLDPKNPKNIN